MLSLSNTEKILEINSPLYSPIEVDDTLLICSYNGEIIKYSEGQLKLLTKINGQVRSIAYDPLKNTYYIADLLKQSIIALNSADFSEAELVNEYEGVPLEGPNSILLSNKTGNVFFTDSGPFGETSLPNNRGSVFIIDMQQQSIRPIILRCLCSPSGLAFNNAEEKVLYVAETGKNRILRFYESPEGVYYSR